MMDLEDDLEENEANYSGDTVGEVLVDEIQLIMINYE